MTPIRSPSPLQRLAWIQPGEIHCIKDLHHPNGALLFKSGNVYAIEPCLSKVEWTEDQRKSDGAIQRIELYGHESAFRVTDGNGIDRWFVEQRLGRKVNVTPISDHDFKLTELIEHFDIPHVKDLAEERPEEYKAAIERIKCLTKI